jgi:predicted DNA-binding antitoxin AbrB/MazE fold protein
MDRGIDAVYEGRVFRPLESLDLQEHQRVTITVQSPSLENPM